MRRSAAGLLLGFALVLDLASCARRPETAAAPDPAPAADAKPLVIAAETFLADIIGRVGGGDIRVESLLPIEVDPHEFQPRPADFARLRGAALLVVAGSGYETWLQSSAGALQGLTVYSLFPGPAADDPHLWMDPRNLSANLDGLVKALSALSPGSAPGFAARAKAYAAELSALDGRIRARIAEIPPARRLLLTNHDALGRFAAAYGLRLVGTVLPGGSSETAPSAKGLSELIGAAKAVGAPALFLDVGENRNLADTVAREAGLRVVSDLYVESLSAPEGPAPNYIAMLEHDAGEIADALR